MKVRCFLRRTVATNTLRSSSVVSLSFFLEVVSKIVVLYLFVLSQPPICAHGFFDGGSPTFLVRCACPSSCPIAVSLVASPDHLLLLVLIASGLAST